MMVGEFRERALANSERELENTVLLLTRHFDQQFEDSDTIAADVISRTAISSIASPETFRERMSSLDGPRDPAVQSRRAVLSRRHLHLRFERRDDQLVADRCRLPAVNISARAYFETFKSDPRSPSVLTRGSSQPYQRQSEHRHCPSAERRRRGVSRRDDTAHQPLQLREILCFRRAGTGRGDLDVPCRRDPDGALSARRCD